MAHPSFALPGDRLAPAATFAPGVGVHVHASNLVASLAGPVSESKPQKSSTANASATSSSRLSITRHSPPTGASAPTSLLPEVDSVVLARVTRLTLRQATVEILAIDDRVCREAFQGIVRREDVRATEKDRVVVADSFRVGDIIRGVVISLGDQSSYYLSTASNEFGVIMATSEQGNQMYPISWQEYKDPKTGATEKRKVAKPF